MFKIGEFSKLCNVSVRMLRHYEKLELLNPNEVDRWTGFRYYTAGQLDRASKIQKLRTMGFSLAIIKEILDNPGREHLDQVFRMQRRQLQEELGKLEMQAVLLEKAAEVLKEDLLFMQYHVVLKEIPQRKVLSVRGILPNFQAEGQLWQKLYGYIGQAQVRVADPGYGMAIFHDAEYKEENVDVEVQTAVEGQYPGEGEVLFQTAPMVLAATVTFNGGFEQMQAVTQAAASWIEANGYRISGPMFNIYHVSPGQDPNPQNWVTEACFSVEKA